MSTWQRLLLGLRVEVGGGGGGGCKTSRDGGGSWMLTHLVAAEKVFDHAAHWRIRSGLESLRLKLFQTLFFFSFLNGTSYSVKSFWPPLQPPPRFALPFPPHTSYVFCVSSNLCVCRAVAAANPFDHSHKVPCVGRPDPDVPLLWHPGWIWQFLLVSYLNAGPSRWEYSVSVRELARVPAWRAACESGITSHNKGEKAADCK